MKSKIYLLGVLSLFFIGITSLDSWAQTNWHVNVGSSFTNYKFKNTAGNLVDYTKPGSGSSFELGCSFSLLDTTSFNKRAANHHQFFKDHPTGAKILNNVFVDIKAQLNQLNAIGSITNIAALKYETTFVGISGGLSYRFFQIDGWQLFGKGNVSVSKMIHGNQLISSIQGAEYIDLFHNSLYPEFNKMQVFYGWEVQIKKQVNPSTGFYIGYGNRSTSNSAVTKLDGTKATLDFSNKVLQAGIVITPSRK